MAFLRKMVLCRFSNAKNRIWVFFSSLEQWQSIQVAFACDTFSMYCQVSLSFVNQYKHNRKCYTRENYTSFSFYAINYKFSFHGIWWARKVDFLTHNYNYFLRLIVLRNRTLFFRTSFRCVGSELQKNFGSCSQKLLPASQKGFVLLASLLCL